MLHITKSIFLKIVPVVFSFMVWILPSMAAVVNEGVICEGGGVYMVADAGKEDSLRSIAETSPIDKNSFASPGRSTGVVSIKTDRPDNSSNTLKPAHDDLVGKKVDMVTPVERGQIQRAVDSLRAVDTNGPKKSYPIDLIPSSLVKAPRGGASAIVVEKSSQTLWLYTSYKGEFLKVFEIPCSTGEMGGPKQVEGDKKTPEGIYFLKQIHEDRFLAPIYGKRAFTTDYPNFFDRLLGKTGSSIWIHGTNKRLKPMDSNGCVAMNNDDLMKLSPYIVLDETPVVIMDRVDYASQEANVSQRVALLDFLSRWLDSLNRGSYLEYLFHYASMYLPDVRWWAEWVEIRSRAARAGNPISAKFENIGIYRHKDHLVVLLDFEVSSRYRTIALGKRELFITEPAAGLSFGVEPLDKSVVKTEGKKGLQDGQMAAMASYSDDSYKIIGDFFQRAGRDKADRNNLFITAAARLDRLYNVK